MTKQSLQSGFLAGFYRVDLELSGDTRFGMIGPSIEKKTLLKADYFVYDTMATSIS